MSYKVLQELCGENGVIPANTIIEDNDPLFELAKQWAKDVPHIVENLALAQEGPNDPKPSSKSSKSK